MECEGAPPPRRPLLATRSSDGSDPSGDLVAGRGHRLGIWMNCTGKRQTTSLPYLHPTLKVGPASCENIYVWRHERTLKSTRTRNRCLFNWPNWTGKNH
ncbi:hypothetical protein CRG98_009586 [Punica granatum]|uniref:Uncharacterized protein n=1 Tax=Punica granatum TaxID=22663 RepID=A0A2I0KNW7_PUNGR|nr:hypothetical protein CRG98_009586 [Punica granatum]